MTPREREMRVGQRDKLLTGDDGVKVDDEIKVEKMKGEGNRKGPGQDFRDAGVKKKEEGGEENKGNIGVDNTKFHRG